MRNEVFARHEVKGQKTNGAEMAEDGLEPDTGFDIFTRKVEMDGNAA